MGIAMLRSRWTALPATLVVGTGTLYATGDPAQLKLNRQSFPIDQRPAFSTTTPRDAFYPFNRHSAGDSGGNNADKDSEEAHHDNSMWTRILHKFGDVKQAVGSNEWMDIDIKQYIIPDWTKYLPGTVQKLQRELSMSPGSLADEIWRESKDADINPEILREARVRVGDTLCPEEQAFRKKRQQHAVKALAAYLDIPEADIHPEDVPIIAMCGSGGGLRALVAGTGSYLAAQEAGLWDCVTYTAGVSGSCWLQTLYHSSIAQGNFDRLMNHLKSRLGVHLAFPPKALSLLTTAPTNKHLLSGMIEKLKGDPGADFGLVDIYGILLSARLLVPRGELGVSDRDLKLSNQRLNVDNGVHPLPIYTAVRHEIPILEELQDDLNMQRRRKPEKLIQESRSEAWFQWFEFTPYEFFCEELGAGIPTWALGRHFNEGKDLFYSGELPTPETRIPELMGVWGSAFCATLSHYYKEIRPVIRGIAGFGGIDSLIQGKTKDLVRVHPIDPATIPNYVLGMKDMLPKSCPESIFKNQHLRLMDAGMSNNLPIYPLLRPGRDVDVIVTFDASADIKRENWLSVVDGYARQRGIKGWPVGAGWPKEEDKPEQTSEILREPQNISDESLDSKMTRAQHEDKNMHGRNLKIPRTTESNNETNPAGDRPAASDTDLTYCNIWVGTMQERVSGDEPPPSKRLFHPQHENHAESDFRLMRPDAGIAVVYFPLLPNSSAPELPQGSAMSRSPAPTRTLQNSTIAKEISDPARPMAPHPGSIDPDVDDFLSTWNFVYTPEQIDSVVGLAKANFAQGEEQMKRVIRAVYERKRSDRLKKEEQENRKRMEGFVPL
ncbi:putative phospholipase A2 (PlaA) [Aspergillus ruber CBS 135680]|uniref:Lysophospholipase n=1 Tax=Aspergillus ruber (strain CBS 135680) TaxID=1388766 RepID=A0A017SKY7_ASPRC|nr:putative phospholipase A2 [Aspergillus ruber CBS 135680]EYE97623.1 putative phospholipase A2 [Aspergillus ruber CBS 135680]